MESRNAFNVHIINDDKNLDTTLKLSAKKKKKESLFQFAGSSINYVSAFMNIIIISKLIKLS